MWTDKLVVHTGWGSNTRIQHLITLKLYALMAVTDMYLHTHTYHVNTSLETQEKILTQSVP